MVGSLLSKTTVIRVLQSMLYIIENRIPGAKRILLIFENCSRGKGSQHLSNGFIYGFWKRSAGDIGACIVFARSGNGMFYTNIASQLVCDTVLDSLWFQVRLAGVFGFYCLTGSFPSEFARFLNEKCRKNR